MPLHLVLMLNQSIKQLRSLHQVQVLESRQFVLELFLHLDQCQVIVVLVPLWYADLAVELLSDGAIVFYRCLPMPSAYLVVLERLYSKITHLFFSVSLNWSRVQKWNWYEAVELPSLWRFRRWRTHVHCGRTGWAGAMTLGRDLHAIEECSCFQLILRVLTPSTPRRACRSQRFRVCRLLSQQARPLQLRCLPRSSLNRDLSLAELRPDLANLRQHAAHQTGTTLIHGLPPHLFGFACFDLLEIGFFITTS